MGLYKYDESGNSVKINSPQITIDPETGERKVHINGNTLTIPKELTYTMDSVTTMDSGWAVNYQEYVKNVDTIAPDKDHDIELVKEACAAFTRLLLKITPFKAKEYVERNCHTVTEQILKALKGEK